MAEAIRSYHDFHSKSGAKVDTFPITTKKNMLKNIFLTLLFGQNCMQIGFFA